MKKIYVVLGAIIVASIIGNMTVGKAMGKDSHHRDKDMPTVMRMIHHALTSIQKSINDLSSSIKNLSNNGNGAAPTLWSRVLPATERFQLVLGGVAVLDHETGVIWERSPDAGFQDWASAQVFCMQKTLGNRKGWRVPAVQELLSLVEPTLLNPALPAGHPFTNVQSFTFWSATTASFNSYFAGVLTVDTGELGFVDKDDSRPVWCVRGGQGSAH